MCTSIWFMKYAYIGLHPDGVRIHFKHGYAMPINHNAFLALVEEGLAWRAL